VFEKKNAAKFSLARFKHELSLGNSFIYKP